MKLPSDSHADGTARIVMLTYGQMHHGGPYWCYVAVKPGAYDRFQAIVKAKKLDLQHFETEGYGEIIVSGEGVVPPKDVTRKVAQMFNIPIRDLFGDVNPQSVISSRIEAIRKNDI